MSETRASTKSIGSSALNPLRLVSSLFSTALARSDSRRKGEQNARLPRHLGIVLDGHGRWATQNGLPQSASHAKGLEAVREAVRGCLDHGIEVLSLYAFGMPDWRCPDEEVKGLKGLFSHYLKEEGPRLAREGVLVRLSGERAGLPVDMLAALEQVEALAPCHPRLILNIAVNYGGREELLRAMKNLAKGVAQGALRHDAIDESVIAQHLFTGDLPAVDLLIRTAGVRRLSNFMLWQCAYAELLFMDILWPDFNQAALAEALTDYSGRRRTFGGLVDLGTPGGTSASA